jgi:AraC-like DNA-binding protein
MEHAGTAAVRYREYLPCEALRKSVGALFSFCEPHEECPDRGIFWELTFLSGERFCAPTFADARACIVFTFEEEYGADGIWRACAIPSTGVLIGPITTPGPPLVPARQRSIGAYLRAGSTLAGVPLAEIEDLAIPLEAVWGAEARQLCEDLNTIPGESARLARLESALLQRMARPQRAGPHLDLSAVAAWIDASAGQLTVQRVAEAAGLSRQHLARVFRAGIGLSPKVYCELARFQHTLGYLRNNAVDWAQAAAFAGYADQSHMIVEFRRFSGMTPETLYRSRWFHPFIERSARRYFCRKKLPTDMASMPDE